MYLHLKVYPNQRRALVEKVGDYRFKVYVKNKAERGLANDEALNLLSQFLAKPRSEVRIISGINTPNKLVVVTE